VIFLHFSGTARARPARAWRRRSVSAFRARLRHTRACMSGPPRCARCMPGAHDDRGGAPRRLRMPARMVAWPSADAAEARAVAGRAGTAVADYRVFTRRSSHDCRGDGAAPWRTDARRRRRGARGDATMVSVSG
jgi:hypothetical protein